MTRGFFATIPSGDVLMLTGWGEKKTEMYRISSYNIEYGIAKYKLKVKEEEEKKFRWKCFMEQKYLNRKPVKCKVCSNMLDYFFAELIQLWAQFL